MRTYPPSQSDQYFFENVDKALDMYRYYDKILLTEDFNAERHDDYSESFLYQRQLKSLVKEKTCFKSISNPSCIDLFLTSTALSFQRIKTVSTGLSDFHKLVLTVLNPEKYNTELINSLTPGSLIGIWNRSFHVNM